MNSSLSPAFAELSISECLRLISQALPSQPSLSDVRASLNLSRLRLGTAMDHLESSELDREQLAEISDHTENIVAELETLLEVLDGANGIALRGLSPSSRE